MSRTRLFQAAIAAAIAGTCAMPAFAQQSIDRVNGGITAEAGQRYGNLETVNGGIDIGDGAHIEDASTVNGGIEAGDDIRAESLSVVNGGVRLGERAHVSDDIETVNGGVFVGRGGQVGGDISTVTGAIGLVDTDVGGDLETVTGDITVGIGSHVKGGIKVEKSEGIGFSFGKPRTPRIVIGPGAVVDGPLVFERDVVLYVHDTARTGAITGATAIRFSTPTPPAD